jgi:hypothetical protein
MFHNMVYTDDLPGTITIIDQSNSITYSSDILHTFGTTPPGTENNMDCGLTAQMCLHLNSLNILRHPCNFHKTISSNTTKISKRWKKRGIKGGKKSRRRTFSAKAITECNSIPVW